MGDAPSGKKPYLNLLMVMYWIGRSTRADILSTCVFFAYFSNCYNDEIYEELLVVLNYLYHTRDYALLMDLSKFKFDKHKPLNFQLICDANFANRDDRKSLIGVFGFLEGCMIFAHCKTMTTVSTSSAQSESHALFQSWMLAKFMNSWCQFLSIPLGMQQVLKIPIPIFGDSEAARAILTKYINTSRVKHFDVQVFAVRDDYVSGFVDIIHISRVHNISDILTHRPTTDHLTNFCAYIYVRLIFEEVETVPVPTTKPSSHMLIIFKNTN